MLLASLSEVKLWLSIDDQKDDEILSILSNAASAFIENACNRKFDIVTLTETKNGNGRISITTDNYPIISVASVVADGIARTDITHDEFSIYSKSQFPPGYRNVIVTYDSGLTAVPQDLKMAALDLILLKWKQRGNVGFSSKSLAGETTSYDLSAVPSSVKQTINNYKRYI